MVTSFGDYTLLYGEDIADEELPDFRGDPEDSGATREWMGEGRLAPQFWRSGAEQYAYTPQLARDWCSQQRCFPPAPRDDRIGAPTERAHGRYWRPVTANPPNLVW